jgi:hypothetical protein
MNTFNFLRKKKWNRVLVMFFVTLFVSFFNLNVNAADGCYVDGVLYAAHTSKSGAYFYRTPSTVADCGVTGTISGSCRLYNSGSESVNSSYTRYLNSFSSNISVTVCPLDDYVWLLIIAIAAFSVFHFRPTLKPN